MEVIWIIIILAGLMVFMPVIVWLIDLLIGWIERK